MAALVKADLKDFQHASNSFSGPLKVADANETDLSEPDISIEIDTRGVRRITLQTIFAGYTAVTVKFQRQVGSAWNDIAGAEVTATDVVVDFAPEAPRVRLSIAGTLSAGADTLEVWCYAKR
jgi:hypothetical protein